MPKYTTAALNDWPRAVNLYTTNTPTGRYCHLDSVDALDHRLPQTVAAAYGTQTASFTEKLKGTRQAR